MGYCFLNEANLFINWFIYKGALINGYIIFKFKNVPWSPWCWTVYSSSFGHISQKDPPNSPPSFIAQRSSVKHFQIISETLSWVGMKKLAMTCILHGNIEIKLTKMVQGQFLLGCQLTVSLSHSQHWNSISLLND